MLRNSAENTATVGREPRAKKIPAGTSQVKSSPVGSVLFAARKQLLSGKVKPLAEF